MKVAFLLNRVQKYTIDAIKNGDLTDDHMYGCLRLGKYGVTGDYLEIEQIFPDSICKFLRKHVLNVYWVHLPFFFKFRKYDVIFSSTAFGCLLLHTLYPFKKPKWVMLDFSITGLIGDRKTFKQKIFYFMVKHCAGIITRGDEETTQLRQMFPEKAPMIETMIFAIDTDYTKPSESAVKEENIIFSPARDPGRDFKTLFEATKDTGNKVIITTRPWTLKKLLPLPSHIIHADLTQDEYEKMYMRAKMIVVPLDIRSNINNAMGCTIMVETMARGKALIVTRTPTSIDHVINNLTGLLIPPQDPDALRTAVMKLNDDPGLRARLGKNAREFAVKYCSNEAYVPRLAEYFKKLAANKTP